MQTDALSWACLALAIFFDIYATAVRTGPTGRRDWAAILAAVAFTVVGALLTP